MLFILCFFQNMKEALAFSYCLVFQFQICGENSSSLLTPSRSLLVARLSLGVTLPRPSHRRGWLTGLGTVARSRATQTSSTAVTVTSWSNRPGWKTQPTTAASLQTMPTSKRLPLPPYWQFSVSAAQKARHLTLAYTCFSSLHEFPSCIPPTTAKLIPKDISTFCGLKFKNVDEHTSMEIRGNGAKIPW